MADEIVAHPGQMRTCAQAWDGLDKNLGDDVTTVETSVAAFQKGTTWGTLDASALITRSREWVQGNKNDSSTLRGIAKVFESKDSLDLGNGWRGLPSEKPLFDLINTGRRPKINWEVPLWTTKGFHQSTGFTNDPINVLSGNFYEVEDDLVCDPAMPSLQWRRSYNSLDTTSGPFGPGWSCWATARLLPTGEPGVMTWLGPDGQEARIPLAHGRVPGSFCHIEADDDGPESGLRLVAPHEGLTWHFDALGRPVLLDNGPADQLRLTWRGQRLLTIWHSRGRSLSLRWDRTASRIVSVESDDGRRVSYSYDDRGRLLTADAPGGARHYEWDGKDRIVAVSDADGVVEARNAYDAERRVIRQTTPFGAVVKLWYLEDFVTEVETDGGPRNAWRHDGDGNLESVVDGLGNEMTTVWSPRGVPLVITDLRGGATRYAYDDAGRVERVDHPDGGREERRWDDEGRLVAVTTPAGTTTLDYEGDNRGPSSLRDPEGGVLHHEFGDHGQVVAVTDPDGVRLELTYDTHGHVVAATDPAGGVRRFAYDAAGRVLTSTTALGHTTGYEYDAAGRITARTDPDGATWRVEYSPAGRPTATVDPLGHRHAIRYGHHGEPIESVDPVGAVSRFDYDTQGNVIERTDASGAVWKFTYDARQSRVSIVDPLGRLWQEEHDEEGDLVATVAPSGRRVETPRDPAGRPLSLTLATAAELLDPDDDPAAVGPRTLLTQAFAGLPEDAEVTATYDPAGRLVALRRADGATVRADYDGCDRLIVLTKASGGVIRFEYTKAGRLSSVVDPNGAVTRYRYDDCGRLAETIDPAGARTRLRHDADGQLIEVVEPTGDRTRYAYDPCGRPAAVTAPNGGVTRFAHDPAGRRISITTSTSGSTRFGYDAAGRMTSITDANGGTSTYSYDAMGNVVATTNPLGDCTTRVFDPCGRLLTVTDPLGRTIEHGYDADGRPATITYPDGSSRDVAPPRVDLDTVPGLQFDSLGRLTQVTADDGSLVLHQEWDVDGNLVAEATGTTSQRWAYDRAGNLVAHTLQVGDGSDPVTTDYTLDACGRPVVVRDPGVGPVTIERDGAGRATRITAPAQGLEERYDFRDGQLAAWSRSLGTSTAEVRYRRDKAGRITSASRHDGTTRAYRYDPAGQLTQARDGDRTWRLRWDGVGRPLHESGPTGERTYRHDAAGQLIGIESPAGPTSLLWDDLGRRQLESGPSGVRSYSWDEEGGRLESIHLTSTRDGDVRHAFEHDLLGRLSAVDGTLVSWDTAQAVPALEWVGGHRVAGVLGAVALVGPGSEVDWVPAVDDRHEVPGLGPWGDPTGAPVGFDLGCGVGGLTLGHRGELSLAGLVWLRARAYDPATRSFISPDPLPPLVGDPWSNHPYHYAANDPVNFCDPLGLQAISPQMLHDIKANFRKGWWEKHWKVVAGVAVAAVGVGLTFTGFGSPLGVTLTLLGGGLAAGGASYAMQEGMTGQSDWNKTFRDAGIGVLTAGVGGLYARALPTAMSTTTRVATVAGAEAGINVAAGGAIRYFDGADPFDPTAILVDAGLGAGIGGGVTAGMARRATARVPTTAPEPIDITPTTSNIDLPTRTPTTDTPLGVRDPDLPTSTRAPDTQPQAVRDPDTQPPATRDPNGEPPPARDPDTQPPATRDPEAEPQPVRDPDTEPQPVRDPDTEPQPVRDPDTEPQPVRDPDTEPRPVRDPDTEPPPARDPNTEPPPTRDPQAEPQAARDPDSEPQAVRDPEAEPQAARDPDSEPQAVRDPEAEPPPARDPDTEPEPARDPQAEPPPARDPDTEPEPVREPEVTGGPEPVRPNEAGPDLATLIHQNEQMDIVIRGLEGQPIRPVVPGYEGVPLHQVVPGRFRLEQSDVAALELAVRIAGRDNPAAWIDYVNPRYVEGWLPNGTGPHRQNCFIGMPAYATTRQTSHAMAAAAELMPHHGGLTPLDAWTGVAPTNTIYPRGAADIDAFQGRAWQHVANQLAGKPDGTVAIVTVKFEPPKLALNGPKTPISIHVFGAEVTPTGLKWVDPQPTPAIYGDWPPKPALWPEHFPRRIIGIESVYRQPALPNGQLPRWETGMPERQFPRLTADPTPPPTRPTHAAAGPPPKPATTTSAAPKPPPRPTHPPRPTTPPQETPAPTPRAAEPPPPSRPPTEPPPTRPPTEPPPTRPAIEPSPTRAAIEPPPARAAIEPPPTRPAIEPPPNRAAIEPGPEPTAIEPPPTRAAIEPPTRPAVEPGSEPSAALPKQPAVEPPANRTAGEPGGREPVAPRPGSDNGGQPLRGPSSPGQQLPTPAAPDSVEVAPVPAQGSVKATAPTAGKPAAGKAGTGYRNEQGQELFPRRRIPKGGTVHGGPPETPAMRRPPSQWLDIADPRITRPSKTPGNWLPQAIDKHFRGTRGYTFKPDERDLTAAFVSNDGKIPRSIAARPDVQADPSNAVRFSTPGKAHAEANIIGSGDLRVAMQDAVEDAFATGRRVTVRVVVNRSPCHTLCSKDIAEYVGSGQLRNSLQRPPHISEGDWDAAMRNVDLELHTPYAYEPRLPKDVNGRLVWPKGGEIPDINTGDLLRLEAAGVRVHVYQPRPGVFRTGNVGGGGSAAWGNDGGGGEALNDTLSNLDQYRLDTGRHPAGHWAD